jgi:hypothetical protein
MAKREKHGFELVATQRRLEDWWLEHVSWPVGGGVTPWPGGRSESIRWLLFEHWGEHGVHAQIEENGKVVSPPRSLNTPCPVLAVALGLLEIFFYEETSRELEEIEWLRQAEGRRSIPDSMRAELLARAKELATSPASRAVANKTPGRSKRMLAQAIAQHLRLGGFTQGEIAALMETTEDVTRHRWKVRGVRSLSAVIGLLPANGMVQP